MRVKFIGCVTKVENKEKKEKNEKGEYVPTGEFYDKITLRDTQGGHFVTMSVSVEEAILPGNFLEVEGTLGVNNYNGKSYMSVYDFQYKEKVFSE